MSYSPRRLAGAAVATGFVRKLISWGLVGIGGTVFEFEPGDKVDVGVSVEVVIWAIDATMDGEGRRMRGRGITINFLACTLGSLGELL